MISDVKKIFDEEIIRLIPNESVRKAILNHERKESCLNRLCEQILIAEKRNLLFKVEPYKDMIKSIAGMFAQTVVKHYEERALSHGERVRLISEADKIKRAEEAMIDLEKEALDERAKIYQTRT